MASRSLIEEALALRDSIHVTPQCRSVIRRLLAENAALREAVTAVADGSVPPEQHGHYLAHRAAVKVARAALKSEAA